MFELYTEGARRTIFFGRYEASQAGSPLIETEHLLLGLLREDKFLAESISGSDSIRSEIEAQIPKREPITSPVDLPLSRESKEVLAYAAQEADIDRNNFPKVISTRHILRGLLHIQTCAATRLLAARNFRLADVSLAKDVPKPPPARSQTMLEPVEITLRAKTLKISFSDGIANIKAE